MKTISELGAKVMKILLSGKDNCIHETARKFKMISLLIVEYLHSNRCKWKPITSYDMASEDGCLPLDSLMPRVHV
jgi:hypothetical protein